MQFLVFDFHVVMCFSLVPFKQSRAESSYSLPYSANQQKNEAH